MRRRVAETYISLLRGTGIGLPITETRNESAWAQFTVQLDNRDSVQERLKQVGVPTTIHYPTPVNQQPAVSDVHAHLPVGDAIATRVLSLPMHPYLSEENISFIASKLRLFK